MLELILALVILGVLLWAITQLPMDPVIAKVIRVVVIVLVVIWVARVLLGSGGGLLRLPW